MPNALHRWLYEGPRLLASGALRVALVSATIRGRIFTAFLAMSVLTAVLGAVATYSIHSSGRLVTKTFDESLMSINFARAAATDFANMRAVFTRQWFTTDPSLRARLGQEVDDLANTLSDDLAVAEQRSQSDRAKQTVQKIRQDVAGWSSARAKLIADNRADSSWATLDSFSTDLERDTDLLVNYTAGDAFLYRERAKDAAKADFFLTVTGTGVAVVLSGLVAFLLARRIIRPVAVASEIANRIAQGGLDGEFPPHSADELGELLESMRTMRDNIRAMMQREVEQRRSAQSRLADALESSHDGIVVVDAEQRIALANAQAADFLDAPAELLAPGTPLSTLAFASETTHRLLFDLVNLHSGAEEIRLSDDRWLRISRSNSTDGGFIALCTDITTQKDQEAKLKATNLRLDAALANMSQGLCLYGPDFRLQVVNRRFCEIFGQAPGSIHPGLSFKDVVTRIHGAGHYQNRALDEVLTEENRLISAQKRIVRFVQIGDNRIVAISQDTLPDGGWLATFEDVTERRQAEDRVAFMAKHDTLTSLPNRTLFLERVTQAIAQAKRGSGCAVLLLDLDQFKPINDALGHQFGDELLRIAAQRLKSCVRDIDTVARFGADEFGVVQCGVDDPAQTVALAVRITEALSAPFQIDGHNISIGATIGITLAPNDATDPTRLIKNADVALYRAKEDARGTWRFFEAAMDYRLQARREMEIDLRRALEQDQLQLQYQPIFDLATDRIVGFEALLRWSHPTRGLIPPADFVPVAEEIGLIREIGPWVLSTACAEASRWPDDLKVAVNVSPLQLRSGDFRGQVTAALAQSGLAADRLELEITESMMLGSASATLIILNDLRALGVHLSMDDFGTGYSSLTSLRSFPFSKIKIDKSFVQDLAATPGAELVIRAVAVLGGGLGMRITAEGVETPEQLARLRAEGCHEVQGYLISPPVAPRTVDALLERWNRGPRRGLIVAVA